MSGRPKIKVYHYSKEGKRIGSFDSISVVRVIYYSGTKYPIFHKEKDKSTIRSIYHELPDGTYIAESAIGRDRLMKQIEIDKAPFIRDNISSRIVEVYNLAGKKIANFKSIQVAAILLNMDQATIQHCCERNSKNREKQVLFKFK